MKAERKRFHHLTTVGKPFLVTDRTSADELLPACGSSGSEDGVQAPSIQAVENVSETLREQVRALIARFTGPAIVTRPHCVRRGCLWRALLAAWGCWV